MKKICVIGAGIYGCHLSLILRKMGYCIDLYDMADDIFTGASRDNSFRIHKGYHYPRSGKTRDMCLQDEQRFCKEYGHLIDKADNNPKIFCIADDENTLIDYNTMKLIIQGANLNYKELSLEELNHLGFANVEGGFRVNESILLVDTAKLWFKNELLKEGVKLKLNSKIDIVDVNLPDQIIVNKTKYDYVINCTYNQALQYDSSYEHYFDLCFSLVVASKGSKELCNINSFGIFDGPYPSLEPYGYKEIPEKYKAFENRKIFQIFHVKHTSVGKFKNINEARHMKENGLEKSQLDNLTNKILEDTLKFYPNFHKEFEVIGNCLALKTKVESLSDTRPLIVSFDEKKHNKFIQVFSSKLTSIFTAEDRVLELLNEDSVNESIIAA